MSVSDAMATNHCPGLYEFLTEAELQEYYSNLKTQLKIQNVPQLKYVTEDDLVQIGMAKPEIRRLKKYFHRYCPQTYLSRFRKILKGKEENGRIPVLVPDGRSERPPVKVPSKHIIPAEAISVHKQLGVGEFGVVQQGVWTNEEGERIQVAIKCLSKDRMQNNSMEFLKEAAIMHSIDHEHIVRLYGVVLEADALMLVTELAPLRSLLECLKEPALRASFNVMTLCDFVIQICDGMHYLETKRLIHRDLAARNILVFSKNKVKISDFGLSRALGVGKDYYQTNFNVNLKLPIAWCAPECINFLRFTCASDVWAFGVTLWEMFSYGFQPWAALTGQQILEAIDEPNFQRLEQPEHAPKEVYNMMQRCWQHDPAARPKFSELLTLLPECKPEQVQGIQDAGESPSLGKRDQLVFRAGEVITVLDKKPLNDVFNVWKGCLNNGKTGLFNPSHTVTYLGRNLPSSRSSFTRPDGKNAYSSKRRLNPDMIGAPLGDLKHTSHVGMDGVYFGDLSFLGDKYTNLPKQVVTPYRPQEDMEPSLTRASSDVSDRAPLLRTIGDRGKAGPAADQNWNEMDGVSEKDDGRESPPRPCIKSAPLVNHEYHEISDEEGVDSPRFDGNFDLGPSLMDEVFRALGGDHGGVGSESKDERDEQHNRKNEIKEITARAAKKKSLASIKPIKPMTASDHRIIENAVSFAKEIGNKALDAKAGGGSPLPSPHSPTSPGRRKFSFRFPSSKSSPKCERRNYSEETASITDIQSTFTEEAKEAYNSLVTAPVQETAPAPSYQDMEEANPLRMLRSGFPVVKPKVRGNKHNISGMHTVERSHGLGGQRPRRGSLEWASLPRSRNNAVTVESIQLQENEDADENGDEDSPRNALPLPPRPTKPFSVEKRHTRKYPLNIPSTRQLMRQSQSLPPDEEPTENLTSKNTPPKPPRSFSLDDSWEAAIAAEIESLDDIPEENASSLSARWEHVSCEDLLEFACDRPNAKRTRGRARGAESDEVHIMLKVMTGHEVTGEDCVFALNQTDWDIHRAIKLSKLRLLLHLPTEESQSLAEYLSQCDWDVNRTASYMLATNTMNSDTTEV